MEATQIRSSALAVNGSDQVAALNGEEWEHVVAAMEFSAQQARIVALIMEEKADKEIAKEMGLRRATIRTHLAHIFKRARASTRVGVVLRVVACARQWREKQGDHPT
jgi:DNA-binding CsgD family transcriptional regulator